MLQPGFDAKAARQERAYKERSHPMQPTLRTFLRRADFSFI
jgi:hypothetical protein